MTTHEAAPTTYTVEVHVIHRHVITADGPAEAVEQVWQLASTWPDEVLTVEVQ